MRGLLLMKICGKNYFHNMFLLCAKLTIHTMLWTKLTIHTINVCGSGYSHIGGGIDIVDLFLIFKIICYNLALVGVTIEKGLHWLPKATIAVDSNFPFFDNFCFALTPKNVTF